MQEIEVNGKIMRWKVSPYNAKNGIGYYKAKVTKALNDIGIDNRYIDISFGGAGGYRENSWAKVEWFVNGDEYSYKCDSQQRDVDNLAAIAQLLETDSKAIRRGLKSFGMVMNQFRIGYDPTGEKIAATKSPREIISVPPDCKDIDYVRWKAKQRMKETHPDVGGNEEDFKKVQDALTKLEEEFERIGGKT